MEVERLSNVDRFSFLSMENLLRGAKINFVTNESFAHAVNLLKDSYPHFTPHAFGKAGQIYDGWETSRHNMFPPDYVTIELEQPSLVHGANIDTAHFDGNYAPGASIEGLNNSNAILPYIYTHAHNKREALICFLLKIAKLIYFFFFFNFL